MDLRYQLYLSPKCKFYKKNKTIVNTIDMKLNSLPKNWKKRVDKEKHWGYCTNLVPIPVQGWKIHISSTLDQMQEVLNTASKILFSNNTQFKFVLNSRELFLKNSKYGDRSSSGKFITVYPATEPIFLSLLDNLSVALEPFDKGPYILTDNRYKDTNVYFRYGGFIAIKNAIGEACILDEHSNLIPDVREPQYIVPDFVDIPIKIKKMEATREEVENDTGKLKNYEITGALHFSNGGGVYVANDKKNNKKVVIKEGRPEAGLDGQCIDAFSRIHIEADNISKLSEIENVVNIYDSFNAWENSYLVEEHVDGIQLNEWIAINYPFIKNENKVMSIYARQASTILEKLIKIVHSVHKSGVGIGDLSPMNILIVDSLDIKIIDFEAAGNVDDAYIVSLQTPGFGTKLANTRRESDLFALLRIAKNMFFPAAQVQELRTGQEVYIDNYIRYNFGEEIFSKIQTLEKEVYEYFPKLKKEKSIAEKSCDNQYKLNQFSELSNNIKLLRNGIIKNSTTKKRSLIGGDIRQQEVENGDLSVLFGSFGVFMTIMRTGRVPKEFNEWIEHYSDSRYINKINQQGLLNGKAGICGVLYEYGFKKQAISCLSSVNYENEKNISLHSGLSGIGLSFLSIGMLENSETLLLTANKIGTKLVQMYEENVSIESIDIDFNNTGLVEGWSGVALFLIALYKFSTEKKWLHYAEDIMLKEIGNCKSDQNKILYINDKNRLLPYLLGGTVGISLPLFELSKISKMNIFSEKLREIKPLINSTCCYNGGLFRGYSSFILLSSLYSKLDYYSSDSNLPNLLQTLRIFILKENNDSALTFGDYGYRLSGDIFSGASGTLLALHGTETKNLYNWLPIPVKCTTIFWGD